MKNTQDKKQKNSPENQENTGERDELGRFVKGISGNPAGKPKGISITALVKAELKKAPEGQELTYAQLFLKKLFKKAIVDGDHATQKLIWNYIDGLPKGELDLTSGGEKVIFMPIEILDKHEITSGPEPNSEIQEQV